jgi:hypothetical protein
MGAVKVSGKKLNNEKHNNIYNLLIIYNNALHRYFST